LARARLFHVLILEVPDIFHLQDKLALDFAHGALRRELQAQDGPSIRLRVDGKRSFTIVWKKKMKNKPPTQPS
jgi:hypothetical protein